MIPIRYSFRNFNQRSTASAMTAASVALVVMVLTILLGFVDGMRRTMTVAADSDNWMLVERGVVVETGGILHDNIEILKNLPQIATDAAGAPLFSPEVLVGFDPTPDSPRASTAMLRAVLPVAYQVHRNLRVIEGHRPERGRNEWMVGQRLAARHPELKPGSKFHWVQGDWLISGIFSDKGSARESEVWCDLNDVVTTLKIPPGLVGANVIHLLLKPGEQEAFAEALRRDSRLRVDLMSERQFYRQAAGFSDQLRQLGLVVAIILSTGAIFGATNTMYSAVARRKREVGTLRVLGFGRGSVLLAFMLESAILGAAGGAAGELLAVALARLTGLESRLMNVGTILFSFNWTWSAFAAGFIAALVMGLIGGILPAWQAARLNVMESLRE